MVGIILLVHRKCCIFLVQQRQYISFNKYKEVKGRKKVNTSSRKLPLRELGLQKAKTKVRSVASVVVYCNYFWRNIDENCSTILCFYINTVQIQLCGVEMTL